MKKIRYIIGMALSACLVLFGCEELTDPYYNPAPSITGDSDISHITAHSATVSVHLGSNPGSSYYSCYFLLSTSPDLSNTLKVDASYNNGGAYSATFTELERSTTYYYTLCISDGRSETRGEIQTFTTSGTIGINGVTLTSWDGSGTSGELPSEIGTFLMQGDIPYGNYKYHNKKVQNNGGAWQLPYEIEANESNPLRLYAYAPYNEKYAENLEIFIDVKNENTDYLYGYSNEITAANPNVGIAMKHILAKVILTITNGSTAPITVVSLNGEVLPYQGWFDILNGKITDYDSGEGIDRKSDIAVGNTQNIEIYTIPVHFGTGNVTLSLNISGHYFSVNMDAAQWDAGKQYTYPVTVNENELTVGSVRVEDWTNHHAGDITVNN